MRTRIFIDDRNYTSWSFHDLENNQPMSMETFPALNQINPVEQKLFSKDIVDLTLPLPPTLPPPPPSTLVHSPTQANTKLAGVLLLENNKTYGRTSNKKRLLYKCMPDDKHLPIFLVPYEVKSGFSKFQKNKYVVFKYDHWKDKHPQGVITETIGDVDSLEAFYEYQLYCKSLHISLTDFNDTARRVLREHTHQEYIERILQSYQSSSHPIEDHRDRYVFTVDPPGSTDFDDGFCIEPIPDTRTAKVTVYIANVYFWLETLSLWKSFSKRVATIYLPDRRRPMLPTVLSDSLCSLQQDTDRFAFSMEVVVDVTDGTIISPPVWRNALIHVKHNYCYEEHSLHSDPNYNTLYEVTKKMDKNVKTSQDVVSHWMVLMNKVTGNYMAKHKIGIFRATTQAHETPRSSQIQTKEQTDMFQPLPDSLDEETCRVIQSWNNNMGRYVCYRDDQSLEHFMLGGQYIHITSPIRRLVDLLNQMILSRHLGIIEPSQDATEFIVDWIEQLEYLNTSMRSIRKVQVDCQLINRCFTDKSIMDHTHTGVVFDKVVKNDGTMHYMVYLEKLMLLSRIVTHVDIEVYSKCEFMLFLFEDEYRVKRKIRLQVVDPHSGSTPYTL